ncbi:Glycerol kinase [Maioricimonas rarisocia]|uniref:Glycerol kinase n=1 Tax=Maioricimonas rarisocia TaxID=2528026 RepID=A0A517ZAF1_9PLAN|nr:FGGY family carbohydrate kinase [Maioricimonas rarisocia]QDU39465.1 Glycerol kinase [Maioricimonas rarisocia]
MPVVLALDLGTTSIAAVAVDEFGNVVRTVQRSHRGQVDGLPTGYAEQDPERLRSTAIDVLMELAASLSEPTHALGLTGQMHSVVLLDRERSPLSNVITWQDRRALENPHGAKETFLSEYLARCDEADLRQTGCRLSPGYAAVTLNTLIRREQLPAAAVTAAQPADWMASVLTSEPVVCDRTNAASTGVYDLEKDCWSEPLLAAGGIPVKLMPPVRESGDVVGRLTDEMARATGLPAGLPVYCALGDNQASVLGTVPAGEPALQITIGTGGQINWSVDRFVRAEGLDTRYLPDGRFLLVGAGLAGGDAYAWVNRTIRTWLAAFGTDTDSEQIYARLDELIAAVPEGTDGLACEPFFRGTRREPERRGLFAGADVHNFTPGHVARAVLEGMAAAMKSVLDGAGLHAPSRISRIIGCGNGLQANRHLVAAFQREFGQNLWFPEQAEGAAFGAALLAGVRTGMWADLEAAGQLIRLRQA